MRRRQMGYGLTAVGLLLVIVGAVGLVMSGDDDTDQPTAVAASSRATATTDVEERADMFLMALAAAVRSGDDTFLFGRLHPEVIVRYGEGACRAQVERIEDATAAFEVVKVAPPAPFVWTLDGVSTTIDDAIAVDVVQTLGGRSRDATVHLGRTDGRLRWFTDCGDPVKGQRP